MTSEIRHAVEVWDDAIAAWAADTIDTRQAAAAVIQADREAVRAEQAAYLAKARKEAGQNHDLHMAAVNKVVDLKAELAKFKALAETLAGALELMIGSTKGNAVVSGDGDTFAIYPPSRQALNASAEALRQYKEARDAS